ncbi:MAG: ParA family protein [Rubricoccaceae bacterium]
MRRVVFNQKGGVGKSSLAVNLAAIAARRGRRTLLVDLDAQANATRYLLGDAAPEQTVADFFAQFLAFRLTASPVGDVAVETGLENLRLVPGSPDLADLRSRLEAKHKIYKLRDTLAALDDADEVFIDTPPALGFFALSALIAADAVLIPFDCDEFARQALYRTLEAVEEVRADHNPALRVEGIVVNQFQTQAGLPHRLVRELRAEGLPLLETIVPASVKMRESHQARRPVVDLAPRHALARALEALADEIGLGR